MKIIVSFGVLLFALSFCGLTEKFINRGANSSAPSSTANSNSSNSSSVSENIPTESAEKYVLTPEQTAISEKGKEVKWEAQGISWKVPASWKEMSASPTMVQYSSTDGAFLIANISPMAADFPADISLKANYDGSETRRKNGELEKIRYVELNGVNGVEFIETSYQGADSPRRQQWIAFRKYNNQQQMLNFMLTTKGANFDKKRDEFAAIMSSTKLAK